MPEYDKAKYPYAAIEYINDQGLSGAYLYCTNIPLYYDPTHINSDTAKHHFGDKLASYSQWGFIGNEETLSAFAAMLGVSADTLLAMGYGVGFWFHMYDANELGNLGDSNVIWSSYNIVDFVDNTVYLSASTPIRADSKLKISIGGGANGDGFALYNGVKLPNINGYGGSFIYKVDLSSVTPNAVVYQLIGQINGVTTNYVYTNNQSLADENGIPSATETWTEFINLVGVYPSFATAFWSFIESSEVYSEPIPLDGMNVIEWDGDTTGRAVVEGVMYKVSNVTDIDLNGCSAYYKASDGSVYGGSLIWQEAQTGLNVGVYGGDTPMCAVINSVDGLEDGLYFSSFSEGEYTTIFAYPASGGGSVTATTADVNFTCSNLENTEPVDSIHVWVYKKSDGLNTTISPTWTSEMFAAPSYSTSYTFTGLTPNTEYEVYGCIFVNGEATDHNSVATFATLEGESITFDKTAFLSGMAMGLTGKGYPAEANGHMSYNGIELADISSIWTDKSNHVFICKAVNSYFAIVSTVAPYQDSVNGGISLSAPFYFKQYGCFTDEATANEYGTTAYTWTFYQEHSLDEGVSNFDQTVIWTSTDIRKDSDNSIFLAASEPFPAGGIGGNDDFTKGYLVGAALRRKRVIPVTN